MSLVYFSALEKIAELDNLVEDLVHKGLDPSFKNIRVHANAYYPFCQEYGLDPFPADNKHLRRYMAHLPKSLQSAESITNYISGVRSLHALGEFPVPGAEDYKTKVQYRRICREKVHPVKQAHPIT